MTLTIGQKGKLGNEILTVVSISERTFKCDNGKMYMIANAAWMTEAPVKEEKTKYNAVRDLTEEEKENLSYLKATGNDLNSAMNRSTANYRNGKSGLSSLTK